MLNNIDYINAIKKFLKSKNIKLVDEISFELSTYFIPIKLSRTTSNSVNELYNLFKDSGFWVHSIKVFKKLPGLLKSPYAIVKVHEGSTFFDRMLVGYSKTGKCHIENNTLYGCYDLRQNLENDYTSKNWEYGIKVDTKDFKYSGLSFNLTSLSFCPFCGEKITLEGAADE